MVEVEPDPLLVSDSDQPADVGFVTGGAISAPSEEPAASAPTETAWDWQPIETAPPMQLVLIAICKGTLKCPVRGDRYVAMAIKTADGQWRLFGQGEIRDDEVITHWVKPVLPPEYPPDADFSGETAMLAGGFAPVNEEGVRFVPPEVPGSAGAAVQVPVWLLQRLLKEAGFKPGPIDGFNGVYTENALKEAQAKFWGGDADPMQTVMRTQP